MARRASSTDTALPNATRLVEFLARLRSEDLPAAVVEQARWVLADTVGCMLGGAATVLGETLVGVLGGLSGRADATIIGTPHRADPVTAAVANAALSDALDYEDTLLGHPSASAVPAALAVGEQRGVSGRALLTAIVAGYEVGVRVGRAITPTPETAAAVASWYHWQAFCAVAAAGHLLQLTESQWLDALGYAGAASPVPVWVTKYGRPVHWLKNNYGEQARAGVLGAVLAEAGFRGPRQLLDHDLGFWRMIGSDRYRPAALGEGLGTRWLILDTTFKPYPCCRYIHAALDALRDLRAEHRLEADTVDRIVIRSFGEMTTWFGDRRPASLVDGEFSVPYVAALVLLGREPGPGWYEPRTLRDPAVLALADRVELERDAECDELFWTQGWYPAKVEIQTRDGRSLRARYDWPRGTAERPLSSGELTDKFLSLASSALPATIAREVLSDLLTMDQAKDVRPVLRRLAPVASA